MPFNGEGNLGVCVIQRLNKHKFNVSVTQLVRRGGGRNFHQLGKTEKQQNLTGYKRKWSPVRLRWRRSGLKSVRSQPDPARSTERSSSYTTENRSWVLPSFFLRPPKLKSKTLTREVPLAQVLGFALLAARHVGLVAALQLSSHWEIRSYKVDSKRSVFIDGSGIRGEEQKTSRNEVRIMRTVRRSALRTVRTSS